MSRENAGLIVEVKAGFFIGQKGVAFHDKQEKRFAEQDKYIVQLEDEKKTKIIIHRDKLKLIGYQD